MKGSGFGERHWQLLLSQNSAELQVYLSSWGTRLLRPELCDVRVVPLILHSHRA